MGAEEGEDGVTDVLLMPSTRSSSSEKPPFNPTGTCISFVGLCFWGLGGYN